MPAIALLENGPQPAQELVHTPAAVLMAEESRQEDGDFVNDHQHRPSVCGAVGDQVLTVTPPVPGVQAAAESDGKLMGGDLVHLPGQSLEPAARGPEKPGSDWRDRMDGSGQTRDHGFLRAVRLHIGEEKHPAVQFESAPQLLQNAGLPHAALAGHDQVVSVADTGLEERQFALPVEEVVAAYPAARG